VSKSPDTLFFTLIPGGVSRRLAKLAFGGWRAFTLIEVLLVVSVIAILGGLGVAVVTNVQETSRFNKLSNDVAVINSAVEIYKASGGSFAESSTVDGVLTKLKTRSDATSSNQIAGFRGRMIDPRLMAEFQSSDEASSSQSRAIWNPATQRFEMVASGSAGVKRFLFDDAAGAVNYGTESRETANKLGTETDWVWDYEDGVASAPVAPVRPSVGSAAASTAPTAPGAQQLSAPTFSPASGSFPIFDFPQQISLVNPNAAGVSQLWYDTGGGEVLYTGGSISVAAGSGISAHARSIDPDRWTDSNPVSGTWQGVPFVLSVALSATNTSISYQQAGGSLPGAPSIDLATASVVISNLSEIPNSFRSSTQFQVFWTYDGTDPLTSGTAVSGSTFQNGVVPFTVDFGLARWSSASSSLQIRAAARAVNSSAFASSAVQSLTINIAPTQLAPPYIDPPSTARSADLPIYIYPAIGGYYPVGTRAYYALGGADPGIAAGGPASGTLYSSAFTAGSSDGSAIVKARYYGPQGLTQWFTPSNVSTSIYTVGAGGTGAVVGDATLNGTYIGSLILISTKNFNLNNGSIIKAGNLFVRGTPAVDTSNGGVIQGRQFLTDGTEVIPATDTRQVVDLTGSASPNNYTIRLNQGSTIEGKIFRRVNIFVPPPVAAPPAATGSGNLNISSQPSSAISPSTAANINLNSGAGNVRLLPGNWGNMSAGSGTSFIIGVAGSTEPTVYNFRGLTLNSNSTLTVVGPVILTIDQGISISSSVMGNPDHPEWLNLRVHSGNVSINSSAAGYANLNAPDSNVSLNGIFTGSVIAKTLTINGNGVAITQATVTDQ